MIGVIIISFIVLIIDIISKVIVSNVMTINTSIKVIPNFFSLTYVHNTGAAFSILEENLLFLIIINMIILSFVIYYILKNPTIKKYETICFGLLLGGGIGNLLNRIFLGYVIDFFHFRIFNYDFAIFNLADTFIVFGSIIYGLMLIKEEYHAKNNRK